MKIHFVPFLTEVVIHARVTDDYTAGRLVRKAGQLLCDPKRESVAWSGKEMNSSAEITCPKCRKMLGLSEPSE